MPSVREIIGEDRYTEVMASLYGMKVTKMTQEELDQLKEQKEKDA